MHPLLVLVSLITTTTLLMAPAGVQDPKAAPTAEHARLAKLAGDWSVVSTFAFPGSAPKEFHGTAQGRAILGGRFLQLDESSVEFGELTEKQKTWGFNVATKRYEGVWIYTGSTAVMHLVGTTADDRKKIAGDASFAGENGEPQKFTWDLTVVDDDHFSTTLVAPAHGDRPAITFTAAYTRAPKK